MSTSHFNDLTEAEQERLSVLLEECSEVVQIGCKILRHGYESCHPENLHERNRVLLEKEVGHVLHAMIRMYSHNDINKINVESHSRSKAVSIVPYLHHQKKKFCTIHEFGTCDGTLPSCVIRY